MKKRKLPSMKSIILRKIILGNYAVVLLGLIITSVFVFDFLKNEIGESRVGVLHQISDLNQINMNAMENVMEHIYNAIESSIQQETIQNFDEKKANGVMQYANKFFQNVGVDSSVDIIFKEGECYASDGSPERINALKKTAWYTYLISGLRKKSWNMNFPNREDPKGVVLSYGKTIMDENGNPAGFVVISTSQETLYKSYVNALVENNMIYILDEAGIVISHPNHKLIGFTFYYMPTFESRMMAFDSYTVKMDQGVPILYSNYQDKSTNWTFVEELNLTSVMKGYSKLIIQAVAFILLCTLIMLGLDFILINKITNSLSGFSNDIKSLKLDVNTNLAEIPVQEQYAEIKILTESFNKMLLKIQELIQNIKKNEEKKRKVEFDFLQAQIQPHFLHNTLITLKSLIVLGEKEKASLMLDDFNTLLRIPMMVDKQFVPLYQEIELVMHYMAIMEYRFDKGFLLRVDVPEGLKNILLPRMILQPIVANAIFHGFAEKESGGLVTVTVYEKDQDLYIMIKDNGEGMTQEQVKRILSGERNINSHHGVGLKNVSSRMQLIYGERAALNITSRMHVGTEITVIFPNYKAVYLEEKNELEDEKNEDISC